MTTKRTRQELRVLFKQGAMPSGVDFSDFIESVLNATDDGIEKPVGADQPLKIMAQGADENLLDFYTKETNTWRINQKTGDSKTGFNLSSLGVSRFFVESESGNVGIGESKPTAKLHIRQTGAAPALQVDDEENETTPFIIDPEGRVGVGTKAPGARLEVNGALKITGAITSPKGILRDDNGGWVRTYGATGWYSQTHGGGWYMKDNQWIRSFGEKNIYQEKGVLRTDGEFHVGPGGSRFIVKGGNVGVGTKTPGARLEVNGGLKISGAITSPEGTLRDDNGGWVRTYGNTGWFSQTHGGGWCMTDNKWIRTYGDKNIYQKKGILRTDGDLHVGENGTRFIVKGGNVGVGTKNPGARLEVNGVLKISGAITSPEGTLRDDNGGWVRTYGATGWYSQTHGGGWYMTDNQWIRTYGNRNIYQNKGILRTDGDLHVGENGTRFIVKGGNVGIGAYNPKIHLAVGDSDTGLQQKGDGNLAIYTNNRERVRVDNAGRLKILADGNPLLFSNAWSRFPDNKKNGAEISNDTTNYKTLMIVGNKSNDGKTRKVSVWDRLEVNGSLAVYKGLTTLHQEAWKAPTFKNGWKNYSSTYNPAGYFKDSMGIVHLRGLVKDGNSGVIFTLPAGYRPGYRELNAVFTNPNEVGRLDVMANGEVIMMVGDKGWFSLDGVTFKVK